MDSTVETGKRPLPRPSSPTRTRTEENFPVASRLIPAALRPHVHRFYLCVRAADDVADSPDLAPADKIALLEAMDAALRGEGADDHATRRASDFRASALETGVTVEHARHLLQAFTMDVTKLRYRNWSELVNYCLYSAAPVGRYLLDLHGEDQSARPATDALCIALQILNHLQDCGDDYRELDRVYIPEPWLKEAGLEVSALGAGPSGPAMRGVLDRMLDRTDELIVRAAAGPPMIRHRGLRLETAVIVAIARRLSARLRRRDPLAGRVELGAWDKAVAFSAGVVRGWRAR
jgi:farnesyl-diphosphate farnesyltransferase